MLDQEGVRQGLSQEALRRLLTLESGGEDVSDAYRTIPVEEAYLRHNLVMLRHPATGALRFVQMYAALFGQGASVYAFARWSAFLEACPRRLLWILWTMYVDDGSLSDPQEAKGSGQAAIHTFFDLIGTGLSEDKREWLSTESVFLGVAHDLAKLPTEGWIEFWPKETIIEALRSYIQTFKSERWCPPGLASKFRGIAGFAAQAQFGQLGRAPMRPFKQRQYWDRAPWYTTNTMERSWQFLETILDKKLSRRIHVTKPEHPALVVASDAQVERSSLPGGGALIHDLVTGTKVGGYLRFGEEQLAHWRLTLQELAEGKQPIALCEAIMLPLTMLHWAEIFRGRTVVWFIDNTLAMASFVKGASANEYLEKIVGTFWIAAYHLDCAIWLEWVDSDSNWADGVSRLYANDPFAKTHGFSLCEMPFPELPFDGEWQEIWDQVQRACGTGVGDVSAR